MLLFSKFTISGHSMEPLLKNGEKILVSNIPYLFKKPRLNDVVALKLENNLTLVKRIISISDKKYFVLGDNKKDSKDGRSFGNLSRKQILGKMIFKL